MTKTHLLALLWIGATLGTARAGSAELRVVGELDAEAGGIVGVSSAGDVNGDGAAELLVETPDEVAVLYGASAAPSWDRLEALGGLDEASSFGLHPVGAGDIDGDGLDDLLVGAEGYGGAAWLYLGAGAGITDASPIAWTTEEGAIFGGPVAGAGDIDGDGLADALVGSDDVGAADTVYVFLGGADRDTDTAATQVWSLDGWSTVFLSMVGDADGDGLDDVVVAQETEGGSAYELSFAPGGPEGVVEGGAEVFDTQPSRVGTPVGDVDGDGRGDLGTAGEGAETSLATVYYGGTGGYGAGDRTLLESDAAVYFGSLAGAGDLDGDGFADVVAGGLQEVEGPCEWHVAVFLGGAAGIEVEATATLSDPDEGCAGSTLVAAPGDIDLDGAPDLVAATTYGEGGAWLRQLRYGAAEDATADPSSKTGCGCSSAAPTSGLPLLASGLLAVVIGRRFAGARATRRPRRPGQRRRFRGARTH